MDNVTLVFFITVPAIMFHFAVFFCDFYQMASYNTHSVDGRTERDWMNLPGYPFAATVVANDQAFHGGPSLVKRSNPMAYGRMSASQETGYLRERVKSLEAELGLYIMKLGSKQRECYFLACENIRLNKAFGELTAPSAPSATVSSPSGVTTQEDFLPRMSNFVQSEQPEQGATPMWRAIQASFANFDQESPIDLSTPRNTATVTTSTPLTGERGSVSHRGLFVDVKEEEPEDQM